MGINIKSRSQMTILLEIKFWSAITFGFAVSFIPLTSWGFDFKSSGYKVGFEESYGKGHSPNGVSLIRTSDGGYAFAGTWGAASASWLVKTDSKGQQQWEQSFRTDRTTSWQLARVVLPNKDGSYLLCGETDALDLVGSQWDNKTDRTSGGGRPKVVLVEKIDNEGQVVWKKIYGRLGKYFTNAIYQGVAVDDGFVFLGNGKSDVTDQPTPSGIVTIRSLWIFKISAAGEMLWEQTFTEDDGEYLKPSILSDNYSKLVIDKAGNIVFAAATEEILSEVKDGKRTLAMRGLAPGPRKKLLIIKLDKNGNELTRTRLAFGVDPTIIMMGDGYHLLDNQPVKDRIGIRSIYLDASLQVISERVIPATKFWVKSAVPGPNGGLHLAGYHRTPPNERGEAAVAYLSKEGELKHEKLFGINSWPADIVQGASPVEAVFLWFGGMQEAAWLTKIKLAD